MKSKIIGSLLNEKHAPEKRKSDFSAIAKRYLALMFLLISCLAWLWIFDA